MVTPAYCQRCADVNDVAAWLRPDWKFLVPWVRAQGRHFHWLVVTWV